MSPTVLSWVVAGSLAFLFFLRYFRAFVTRISGLWSEEPEEGQTSSVTNAVRLRQFGPWVWGRVDVEGGFQQYSGWFDGRRLELRRKDFGRAYFERIGFPSSVIHQLEGTEISKMEFEFRPGEQRLVGKQFRQKIEIDRQRRNPVLVSRLYLPGVSKTWKRMSR